MVNKKIQNTREIRFDVKDPASGDWVFVYARVVASEKQTDGTAHWVRVSYLSPEVKGLIEQLAST